MNLFAIAGVLLGVVSLVYAFRSKTVDQHPSQRGLFVGTGLALIAVGAVILFEPNLPAPSYDSLLVIPFIVLSVLMVSLLAGYPFAKKAAGTLIYNIPRPMSRKISGMATSLLFFILFAFRLFQEASSVEKTSELVFYLSVIAYFASPLFGKVALCENGILETSTLYRWKSIISYRWTGQDENFLCLGVKSFWRKEATIDLPPDHKNAVDEILKQQIHNLERAT